MGMWSALRIGATRRSIVWLAACEARTLELRWDSPLCGCVPPYENSVELVGWDTALVAAKVGVASDASPTMRHGGNRLGLVATFVQCGQSQANTAAVESANSTPSTASFATAPHGWPHQMPWTNAPKP